MRVRHRARLRRWNPLRQQRVRLRCHLVRDRLLLGRRLQLFSIGLDEWGGRLDLLDVRLEHRRHLRERKLQVRREPGVRRRAAVRERRLRGARLHRGQLPQRLLLEQCLHGSDRRRMRAQWFAVFELRSDRQ